MNVVLVNARYHPYAVAGPAFSTQYLGEGLRRFGHSVSVVCRQPVPGLRVGDVNGVAVHYLGADRGPKAVVEDVARIVETVGADVVHLNFLGEFPVLPLVQRLRQKQVRLVHTLQAYSLLCRCGIFAKGESRCASWCSECRAHAEPLRRIGELLDAVTSISQFVLDRHHECGFFLQTTTQAVIRDIYDRPASVISPGRPPEGGRLRLGYLGRLHPTKGLGVLYEALKMRGLAQKCELHVAGRGEPSYERFLRSSCPVAEAHFHGFLPREEFFPKIDILIVPSTWDEPLGRIIYEAYAWGVPVICSRRGGMPEIVEEGKTGLLFDPTGPEQLRALLSELSSDRAQISRMSHIAVNKCREFSTSTIVPQYLRAYGG